MDTFTVVRSVKDAPIRRSAASDMRLPAEADPAIGSNVAVDDLPVAGLVTRPCISVFTKGVFNHNPGSVALPSDATVDPSCVAPVLAGREAAARCLGVVVSSASAVFAVGDGAAASVTEAKADGSAKLPSPEPPLDRPLADPIAEADDAAVGSAPVPVPRSAVMPHPVTTNITTPIIK